MNICFADSCINGGLKIDIVGYFVIMNKAYKNTGKFSRVRAYEIC